MNQGFFFELISVVGPKVPVATISLTDGLNVIEGASDTGKSYLCGLMDFAFGASTLPRPIEQARNYTHVIARLRERKTQTLFEIERALVGGDVKIRWIGDRGDIIQEVVAKAKHDPQDPNTVSAFLLERSGIGPRSIRKNKIGETRSLSFRNIAFLLVVDEARIISERPPHLTGNVVEATAEGEVFRLLVTGIESTDPIIASPKITAQNANAQLEIVHQLVRNIEDEMVKLQINTDTIEEEIAHLDGIRAENLQRYESSRLEIVSLEGDLATFSRILREYESRMIVAEGLTGRYSLLARHYESDVKRLLTIEETGKLLGALPTSTCPVCGAAPEDHQPEDIENHFNIDIVRNAAKAEQEKIQRLRADLDHALAELKQETDGIETQRSDIRLRIDEIRSYLSDHLQPQMRTSLEQFRAQDKRRDELLRGRVLSEQQFDLIERITELQSQAKKRSASAPVAKSGPTTAGMDSFTRHVQEILTGWNFPDVGRVVFSEDEQDIIVGGQPRDSHGKGVRALTCSAYIAALMRHCLANDLPHPGVVVLDSPLVAYKAPDATQPSETTRIRDAGVKDAFYRALADGQCLGQIIVMENQSPPDDVVQRISHHHFSKSENGRYGFFPA